MGNTLGLLPEKANNTSQVTVRVSRVTATTMTTAENNNKGNPATQTVFFRRN